MKWSEMTDKDKIELIMRDVLGWRVFQSWDDFYASDEYKNPTHPMALPWGDKEEDWYVFYGRGVGDTKVFAPLHDMNAAWEITESEQFRSVDLKRHESSPWVNAWNKYTCAITRGNEVFQCFGSTPQEAICLAALRSCGVVVEA